MIGIVSDDLIQSRNQDVIGVEVVCLVIMQTLVCMGIQRKLKTDQIDKAKELCKSWISHH